jgi:Domain of unknown function (DUF4062)
VDPIKIFVASPGDVAMERNSLARVVEDINLTLTSIAPEKGLSLELLRWETRVQPAMGGGAQSVIDIQIGTYDVFVGVMWKRFGTPTGDSSSGTEHEFRLAYDRWQKKGKPEMMFYFCQAPFPPPSSEEWSQFKQVADFRDELSRKGLIWEYPTHDSFGDIVRGHLVSVLGRMLSQSTPPKATAEVIGRQALIGEGSNVREEVAALARNFEDIRFHTPWSDERTRKLEGIYTEMRARAPFFYGLLTGLVNSPSPGERLVAVAVLERFPTADYLLWIADRLDPAGDTPFIRYHAAVALLVAVRVLDRSECRLLEVAVRAAKYHVQRDNEDPGGSRLTIIADAEHELKLKCNR